MTDTATDAFPVEWLDPSDPELTWEWDDMHMPFVLTPMAGDYVGLIGSGFAYGYAASRRRDRAPPPGLERLRLLRPRAGRPRSGAGGRLRAADRGQPRRRSR